MKKIFISLTFMFVFALTSTSAMAQVNYYDGEALGVCSYVDRYDSQEVNLLVFLAWGKYSDGSLAYVKESGSSYYSVRTMVVGYTSANSYNATLNGRAVGPNTDYILCPTSYLASGTGATGSSQYPGYFYAGRIHNWLLPKSYFVSGSNSLLVNVDGESVSMNIGY